MQIARILSFIVLFGLIFFICGLSSAKQNIWQVVHHSDNVKVWKLAGQKDVIGTLQTSRLSKSVDLKNIQAKDFFIKFKNSRKKALEIIGITQWVASDYKWKKKANYYELTLNGTYRNAQNQLIRFYETHLFYQQKGTSILFSYPSRTPRSEIHRSIASQFVKKTKRILSK